METIKQSKYKSIKHEFCANQSSWGPFLERHGNFSGPKSHSKISNLTISELLHSQIFNMKRSSLHTRSFRCIHFSVFRYRWTENGFTGPKSFRGFRETGSWYEIANSSALNYQWQYGKQNTHAHKFCVFWSRVNRKKCEIIPAFFFAIINQWTESWKSLSCHCLKKKRKMLWSYLCRKFFWFSYLRSQNRNVF